jgi:hypothetical protein
MYINRDENRIIPDKHCIKCKGQGIYTDLNGIKNKCYLCYNTNSSKINYINPNYEGSLISLGFTGISTSENNSIIFGNSYASWGRSLIDSLTFIIKRDKKDKKTCFRCNNTGLKKNEKKCPCIKHHKTT